MLVWEFQKKVYGLFMDGVHMPQEPLRGDSLLFTAKFPGIPGTHLINLGRMKG